MDTQAFKVEVEQDDGHGRYFIPLEGGRYAEMTFRQTAPGTFAFEHTFVPPQYRGHGIAELLMNRAVKDARARGFKIAPICSYVVAQFRRHPDWQDLKA